MKQGKAKGQFKAGWSLLWAVQASSAGDSEEHVKQSSESFALVIEVGLTYPSSPKHIGQRFPHTSWFISPQSGKLGGEWAVEKSQGKNKKYVTE